jgi:hypothetical protein
MTDNDLALLRVDLVKLRVTIRNMSWDAKRDLLVMFKILEKKLKQLDTEQIECRRKGKITPRYTQLLNEIQDQKDQLVLYHVMGRLM